MKDPKPSSPRPPIHFRYTFKFMDKVKTIEVNLDPESLALQKDPPPSPPDWARLSFEQCANCPLKETQSPYCPIALNLVDVIAVFKDDFSYKEVEVEIATEPRTYLKNTALQYALSSLFGLIIVTSGCPVMDPLRPLVQVHLPFATLEETTFRVLSLYLLRQYFRLREGETPDWELKGIVTMYQAIQTANLGLRNRFAKIGIQDAALNAIFHLDCYASFTNLFLLEKELMNLKPKLHLLSQPREDTHAKGTGKVSP